MSVILPLVCNLFIFYKHFKTEKVYLCTLYVSRYLQNRGKSRCISFGKTLLNIYITSPRYFLCKQQPIQKHCLGCVSYFTGKKMVVQRWWLYNIIFMRLYSISNQVLGSTFLGQLLNLYSQFRCIMEDDVCLYIRRSYNLYMFLHYEKFDFSN